MPDLLTGIACREIPARLQARAAGDLRRPVSGGAAGAGLSHAGAAAATGAGEGTPCGDGRGIESRPVRLLRQISRRRARSGGGAGCGGVGDIRRTAARVMAGIRDGRVFARHQTSGMEGSDRA